MCVSVAAGDGTFTCSANIPSAASAGPKGVHTILGKGLTSLLKLKTKFTLT
jgi:hypothetical protein